MKKHGSLKTKETDSDYFPSSDDSDDHSACVIEEHISPKKSKYKYNMHSL